MDDRDLVNRISHLVAEENDLRSHSGVGVGLGDDGRERLKSIEVQLDQCWDLLRRRQAREEFGENPDSEQPRPPDVVEHYQQ